jgi:DNA-directed RNA polymerase subunit K/omega
MADVEATNDVTEAAPAPDQAPAEKAQPIESRFLFVDVSAQRAKQLRRGALPRVTRESTSRGEPASRKLERVAMEEVRQGFVHYTLPPVPGRRGEASS